MIIVDAHAHVWDPRRLEYPWLAGAPTLDRPFLPRDYPHEGPAIFVEADTAPRHRTDEADWAASLEWPGLAGIVAAIDLRSSSIDEELDAVVSAPGVVGVRHLLQDEPEGALADPVLGRGLAAVARRGLAFDACIRHHQLAGLVDLVKRAPGLRVVLDHLGKPPIEESASSDASLRWRRGLTSLAAIPGSFVKLSGLPAETPRAAAYDAHVDDLLRVAVDVFGPERAMVGSDWPVSAMLGAAVEPDAWFARVEAATRLSSAEWMQVVGRTAAEFYRVATITE